MKPSGTKETILEAAERQFARNGYHGSSIRAITEDAGVNLASINYHFGTKQELLKAVFERRFVPINKSRLQRLESILAKAAKKGKRPIIKDIIRAFVEPALEVCSLPETISNVMSIVLMSFAKKDAAVSGIMHDIMIPMSMKFHAALKQALPKAPEMELMWKMHFMVGTFVHTLRLYQMDQGFMGMSKNMDRGALLETMVKFIEAGMKAR